MNALTPKTLMAVAPIDWPRAAANPPKPPQEEQPEPPVAAPEPFKPGMPTRNGESAMASPADMMLGGLWKTAALSGSIWMAIAFSALLLPYELTVTALTPEPPV